MFTRQQSVPLRSKSEAKPAEIQFGWQRDTLNNTNIYTKSKATSNLVIISENNQQ